MNINKEDLPLYVLLVLFGSGGGTVGGQFFDDDQAVLGTKEKVQDQSIQENKRRIDNILLKQCQ